MKSKEIPLAEAIAGEFPWLKTTLSDPRYVDDPRCIDLVSEYEVRVTDIVDSDYNDFVHFALPAKGKYYVLVPMADNKDCPFRTIEVTGEPGSSLVMAVQRCVGSDITSVQYLVYFPLTDQKIAATIYTSSDNRLGSYFERAAV